MELPQYAPPKWRYEYDNQETDCGFSEWFAVYREDELIARFEDSDRAEQYVKLMERSA